MISRSVAQIATASMRTRTSARPGTGVGLSRSRSSSGLPSTHAFICSGTGNSGNVLTTAGSYIGADPWFDERLPCEKYFYPPFVRLQRFFVADGSFVSIDIGCGCRANPSPSISPVTCIQNGDARGAAGRTECRTPHVRSSRLRSPPPRPHRFRTRPTTYPGLAGNPPYPGVSDGLPDCLNHERLGARNFGLGLLASGKWSGHDADTFKVGFNGWSRGRLFCHREHNSRPTDDPRRLDHSGRGIEILDDAPAGRISRSRQDLQYRMDPIPGHRTDDAGAGGRCARLRNAGAFVAGEWRGRRQSEGLHRGTARVRKARRLFGLLGGERGFANQD